MEPVNDDTRVREHLANERTYLAWMRTGIATMGFGVVIARLRYLFPPTTLAPPSHGITRASNLGLLFTFIGLLTVVLSARQYIVVQKQIREQRYRASSGLVLRSAAVVIVLGFLIIWYLMGDTLKH